MTPKYEFCVGSACVSLATAGAILHDLYFTFAFVAAFCGAVLGLHGLYQLVRGVLEKHL